MKRKKLKPFVLILVFTMCVVLSACSGSTEPPVGQKPTTEPIQSEEGGKLPSKAEEVESPNDTSLSLMKEQAAQNNPGAVFAAAFLGRGTPEQLERSLQKGSSLVEQFPFLAQMDDAQRLSLGEGTQERQLYCVFPVAQETSMSVCTWSEEIQEYEEWYYSENGEPVLLFLTDDAEASTSVSFFHEGWDEAVFWPDTHQYGEQEYLLMFTSSGYDFTPYPNGAENAMLLAENLMGYWTQAVCEAEEDFRSLNITLWLSSPYNGIATFDISDERTLEYVASYEGTWICKDAEYLELDLTCTENYSGLDLYDKPIKGTYFYSYAKSDDLGTSLTLSVKDKETTPLYTGHAYEPITFNYINPDDFAETEEMICSALLTYHEVVYGHCPGGYASDYEDGCLVVHLFDDLGDHISTIAWYMVDTDSLEVYDYMTGEPVEIDLLYYADYAFG